MEEEKPTAESEQQEAPVLPVSSGSTTIPPSSFKAEKTEREKQPITTTAGVANEDASASNLWGMESKIDAWQVSSMPEKKTYFALDANLMEAAITAIKARLGDKDSNIRGTWLLTEVDHWDLEKERIVVLSDNNLISIKYNFILSTVEELKYIPLSHIQELLFGDFKYTSSYVFSRACRGIKVSWQKDTAVGFMDRWNPLSSKIPHTIFISHVLVRRKKANDTQLKVENAVYEIEKAIKEYRSKNPPQTTQQDEASASPPGEFAIKEGDIVVSTYLGLTALVHNGSNLGFFKRRGAVNW